MKSHEVNTTGFKTCSWCSKVFQTLVIALNLLELAVGCFISRYRPKQCFFFCFQMISLSVNFFNLKYLGATETFPYNNLQQDKLIL